MKLWVPTIVEVPLTVDTSAYAAGDVVGGLLSCAVPQIAGGGYIAWVRLTDDDDEAAAFSLYAFHAEPSDMADQAAFAPTESDWTKLATKITISTYDQTGSEASAVASGKDATASEYLMFPNLADGNMYFYLVATGTPTYTAADDLTLQVCFMLL